jgi:hypothetical protein
MKKMKISMMIMLSIFLAGVVFSCDKANNTFIKSNVPSLNDENYVLQTSGNKFSAIIPSKKDPLVGYRYEIAYSLYKDEKLVDFVPFEVLDTHYYSGFPETYSQTLTFDTSNFKIRNSNLNTLLLNSVGTEVKYQLENKLSMYKNDFSQELSYAFPFELVRSLEPFLIPFSIINSNTTTSTTVIANQIVTFTYEFQSAFKYDVELEFNVFKYTRSGKNSKWNNLPTLVNSETSKVNFYSNANNNGLIGSRISRYSDYIDYGHFLQSYYLSHSYWTLG